jgi:hypothetical protein
MAGRRRQADGDEGHRRRIPQGLHDSIPGVTGSIEAQVHDLLLVTAPRRSFLSQPTMCHRSVTAASPRSSRSGWCQHRVAATRRATTSTGDHAREADRDTGRDGYGRLSVCVCSVSPLGHKITGSPVPNVGRPRRGCPVVVQGPVPPDLAGVGRLPLGERRVVLVPRLGGGEQLLAPDPERHAVGVEVVPGVTSSPRALGRTRRS